ncbi:MAG: nitronate monooxygenase [Chlorobi bacterium]|nr:nitronate monooxygenase [Chlorobiota bacterium]
MQALHIGELEVRLPIIQGGMGVAVSLSGLASAVANEGGVGIISSAGIGMMIPDFSKNFREANKLALRQEIRKARKKTNGAIGVNIMVALSDYTGHLEVSVEEGADLIISGAGLPLKMPDIVLDDKAGDNKTKFIPITSSARAAKLIFGYWADHYGVIPDAVVVEGPLAGGHLGFKKAQINDKGFSLEKLVPEVVSVIKPFEQRFGKGIPVIAGGGIYTGADMHKIMSLGASGVQIATRLVPTFECDASIEFKEAYINSKEEDIMLIESPVGLPGRAIRNKFLEDVAAGVKKPIKCPWKCIKTCDYKKAPYCISLALINASKGNLKNGFVFAGSNAHRTTKIQSVEAVLNEMVEEYQIAQTGVAGNLVKNTLAPIRQYNKEYTRVKKAV